jgi:hypothetical protein
VECGKERRSGQDRRRSIAVVVGSIREIRDTGKHVDGQWIMRDVTRGCEWQHLLSAQTNPVLDSGAPRVFKAKCVGCRDVGSFECTPDDPRGGEGRKSETRRQTNGKGRGSYN